MFKIKTQKPENKLQYTSKDNIYIVITEVNKYGDIETEYLYNLRIGVITQIK